MFTDIPWAAATIAPTHSPQPSKGGTETRVTVGLQAGHTGTPPQGPPPALFMPSGRHSRTPPTHNSPPTPARLRGLALPSPHTDLRGSAGTDPSSPAAAAPPAPPAEPQPSNRTMRPQEARARLRGAGRDPRRRRRTSIGAPPLSRRLYRGGARGACAVRRLASPRAALSRLQSPPSPAPGRPAGRRSPARGRRQGAAPAGRAASRLGLL